MEEQSKNENDNSNAKCHRKTTNNFGSKQTAQLKHLEHLTKNESNTSFLSMLNKYKNPNIRSIRNCLILIVFVYCYQLSGNITNLRKLYDLKCSDAKLLWKGDVSTDLPIDKVLEVSLVISYCGEDANLITNYINDRSENVEVRNITILSRCPVIYPDSLLNKFTKIRSEWQYADLQFMQWLATLSKSAASQLLPDGYLQENHLILFLNARSMQEKGSRKIEQVLQMAQETGFGCIERPPGQLSYYHGRDVLRSYANPDKSQQSSYISFGDWLDQWESSSILAEELVPVCYGSSFAIQSLEISLKSDIYYRLELAMDTIFKSEQFEFSKFLEHSWAAIFSYHLSEKKIQVLNQYSTDIDHETHTGSLIHRWVDHQYFKVFTGDTIERKMIDRSKLRLTLVIAHCNEDMSWMQEYLMRFDMNNITIYSKCSSYIEGYAPPGSVILHLPNLGRCDHTYAHWMRELEEKDATENHLVIFLKASRNLYQLGMTYRPLNDVLRIAKQNGFSCEAEPTDQSLYFNTTLLRGFKIKEHRGEALVSSNYTNMGHWLDDLEIELISPITPVCFGGNFVVKASQIYSKRDLWEKIETSLMNGNSVEEGHFAERAWAGILSNPLSPIETDIFKSIPRRAGVAEDMSYIGHMILDE